jgi:outer membrane protein OmpA-like peptidoglycan-associated protein
MLSEDELRQRRRIWILGTAALLLLAAASVAWVLLHIPGDIHARTVAALQTAGLDPRTAVAVDGRTVILSGEVPDAYIRARMRAIAGSVRGVRTVLDHLSVAPLEAERFQPAGRVFHTPPPAPAATTDPFLEPAAESTSPTSATGEPPTDSRSDPPIVPAAPPSAPSNPALPDPVPAPLPRPTKEKSSSPREIALAPAVAVATTPRPAAVSAPLPRLHFDFDSTRLTPASVPRLRELVEALQQRPEAKIELGGHTDAVGRRSYNQTLSLRRARAVADWLVSAGIDGARLQTRGYGDSRPLTDNHSRKGRAMNRRVELIVVR